MAETGQGAWTSSDAQKKLVKALVLSEQAKPNGARTPTEHAKAAIKQLGFEQQSKDAITRWINRQGLVPEEEKAYTPAYVDTKAKAPAAIEYESKLYAYAGGGERRIADYPLAIQHPDQPTDDPEKLTQKWNDFLYAKGVTRDMRETIVRDTARRSWSHHEIMGTGPAAIEKLVAARAHPEPWNSKYYDGQRYQGLETKRKASSKKGGETIHEDAEEAWRSDVAFSHMGPPKKTVKAERHRLKTSEAAAVQIAEGRPRLATNKQRDADKDRFRRRPRARKRGEKDCWICQRDLMDCGQDVDDHEWGGARRLAPCGNTDNSGVVTAMDIVRGQGMERKHTRLFSQSLFALMKRRGPYPQDAVAIADEARRVARAATWTTKAAVLNSKSALEERSDRLKRKARDAARRSPKKQRPSPKKVPPARIIRDDDGVAHAAPPPPGPGPDEFDEALAEAKRAVGALARFADDSRATSARAELLNALTGFGI